MFTDRSAWDRQSGEPRRAYHAFSHYRDAGAGRSIAAAWRHHKATCEGVQIDPKDAPNWLWKTWCSRWSWVARVDEYELDLEREKLRAFRDEQVRAAERHARALQAAIVATTAPIRIALETATTPTGLERLRALATADAHGLRTALIEARLAAVALPPLVAAERLTLGMPDGYHVIEERESARDPVVAAIARGGVALDAAVQLLHIAAAGEQPVTEPPTDTDSTA